MNKLSSFLTLLIALTFYGCGASMPQDLNNSNNQESPGTSPAAWTSVSKKVECLTIEDNPPCLSGAFVISSDGKYRFDGINQQGIVESADMTALARSAVDVASQDLSGSPQCSASVGIPEIRRSTLTMSRAAGEPVTVVDLVPTQSKCVIGDAAKADRLDAEVSSLLFRVFKNRDGV